MKSRQEHVRGIKKYLKDFWNTDHLSSDRFHELVNDFVESYRAAASQNQPGGLDFWVSTTYPSIKLQYGLLSDKWKRSSQLLAEDTYVSPFDGQIK
tara:strand:- start:235 stop:522 length:288 start_codon:yes stop_codon:yes gene_type:complete